MSASLQTNMFAPYEIKQPSDFSNSRTKEIDSTLQIQRLDANDQRKPISHSKPRILTSSIPIPANEAAKMEYNIQDDVFKVLDVEHQNCSVAWTRLSRWGIRPLGSAAVKYLLPGIATGVYREERGVEKERRSERGRKMIESP
jgi:hypothetical protein